uniref:Uncharacterized protein n=1 Tax=Aeromonas hydrophila TaxID=644 RepID=G9GAY8_AERHY|nr:hypothetical protein [Aeromonas hydrophila]
MFCVKRRRGRPKTGGAKSGAERQAAYRAIQQGISVTVTINRAHLDGLSAQLQAIRDGGSAVVLTPGAGRGDLAGDPIRSKETAPGITAAAHRGTSP